MKSRDNSTISKQLSRANFQEFHTTSNALFVVSDEDIDSGIHLENRKRQRGESGNSGIMDVDGGLIGTGPHDVVSYKEVDRVVGEDTQNQKYLIMAGAASQTRQSL